MSDPHRASVLSAREKDAFILMLTGKPDTEIASLLGCCRTTVRMYRGRIKKRLGVDGTWRSIVPVLIATLSKGGFHPDLEINARAKKLFIKCTEDAFQCEESIKMQIGSLVAGLLELNA